MMRRTLLENNDEAEDVVQSVFTNWWEKRNNIQIEFTCILPFIKYNL